MVRQDGRRVVHFDDGTGGGVCYMAGETSATTTDVHLVDCGRCERTEVFQAAWASRSTKLEQ